VRTREENSTDWIQIGDAFRNTRKPIREIARDNGISDTAIRKEAKKRKWSRPDVEDLRCEPSREPDCEPEQTRVDEAIAETISARSTELVKRGRRVILDLMSELEFLNKNASVLSELVEQHFNGEKDGSVKGKLLKALDHETRTKSANYLATALAKLTDAAPGKKDQAKADAETAGHGSGWGDDLDTGIAGRPN
jgi:predicted transcriptional regulator